MVTGAEERIIRAGRQLIHGLDLGVGAKSKLSIEEVFEDLQALNRGGIRAWEEWQQRRVWKN